MRKKTSFANNEGQKSNFSKKNINTKSSDKTPFSKDSSFRKDRENTNRDNDFSSSKRFSKGDSSSRSERPNFSKDSSFRKDRENTNRDNDFSSSKRFAKGDSTSRSERSSFSKDSSFRKDRENTNRDNDFSSSKRFSKGDSSSRSERPNFSKDSSFRKDRENANRDNDSSSSKRFSKGDSSSRSERPNFSKDSSFRKDRENTNRDNDFSSSKRFSKGDSSSRSERPNFSKDSSFKKKKDFNQKDSDLPFLKGMPKVNQPNRLVTSKPSSQPSDETRLNKYIANAGICSRRKADELISQGQVQVNGVVIYEMGYKVLPKDIVTYNGKKVVSENKVYVLLNKPKDFITTTSDERDRKTVMQLIKTVAESARLYPVGRLDRNTTGLLLLTNDGELAQHLSHPSTNVVKVYQVELDKPIKKGDLELIRQGVLLEDGMAHVDEIDITEPQVDARFVGVAIHSGKNRIVRRIFEHLGYEVKKLDRVSYAGLTKKDLPRGNWRYLTEKEWVYLKHLTSGSIKK
ncbi:MAG: pseudouridine synthase [Chitinophagales bacterium]|nr:pseudouridine synthase [Chitinophagales bacterium]